MIASTFAPINFNALIEPVARELLGEPTRTTPDKLIYGETGKLIVRLKGMFEAFHERGADGGTLRGGTLALIEYVTGLARRDCMRWLADHGFIADAQRPDQLPVAVRATLARPLHVDDDTPARNESAAERARWIWNHATAPHEDHPYLLAKGIGLDGLPVRDYRGMLVVPLYSSAAPERNIIGLQFIHQDGSKRYNKGIKKAGAYTLIGEDAGIGRLFCEGLATGATLHATTDKQIVVALDAGNLSLVAQALARPGDAIAADNDNASKPADRWARPPSDYGTGHRHALAAGLPVYLPHTPGLDFNDLGIAVTREHFARPPITETPVLDPWTLERLDTDRTIDALLAELHDTTDPQAAAALAFTIARRLARTAPAQRRLPEIRGMIERASAPLAIHPATLDGIMDRLQQSATHRRGDALRPVRPSKDRLDAHAVARLKTPPALKGEHLHGVILLRAPMGSGKTQITGRSAADLAESAGLRFVAITHRRTLVRELAERLALEHYGDLDRAAAEFAPNLATCLPSIAREDHAPLIDNADVVFIDEIAQVLAFLESEGHCRTARATNQTVYLKLRQIIANARCVIGADANLNDRVIAFIESCRPGEPFRIIDILPPHDAGISARYRYGQDAPAAIVQEVMAELAAGGSVWLAVESRRRAQRLAELFEPLGLPMITVHADNTGAKPQRAFLADADGESRQYRLVIASPVISSGISIEHRNAAPSERFTLGAYIGGGHSTTPTDAAQQLRRVRYLERFELGFTQNNQPGDANAAAMLDAAALASRIEGIPIDATDFDRFVAGIRAEHRNSRADFAAGLLWQLDAAGWKLERAADTDAADTNDQLRAATAAAEAKRRALIIAAPHITDAQAAAISGERFRTEGQSAALEAWRIRSGLGLGLMAIDDALLDFWEDGAILARLDRRAACLGMAPAVAESDLPLSARRHHRAMVAAYRDLFQGVDLTAPDFLTPSVAETLLDRIMARRDLYSHLGIVGPKFAQCRLDRQGHRLPMKRPGYAARELIDVVHRMGLETESRRVRIAAPEVTDQPVTLTGEPVMCHTDRQPSKPPSKRKMVRVYGVTAASLALIDRWTSRRAAARGLEPLDLHPLSVESAAESEVTAGCPAPDAKSGHDPGGCEVEPHPACQRSNTEGPSA